eukprot:gene9123-1212_t
MKIEVSKVYYCGIKPNVQWSEQLSEEDKKENEEYRNFLDKLHEVSILHTNLNFLFYIDDEFRSIQYIGLNGDDME